MLQELAAWWGRGTLGQAAAALAVLCLVVLFAASVALAVVDAREHRLPGAWVRPLYPTVGLGLAAAACLGRGADPRPEAGSWWEPLVPGAVGLALHGGLFLLARLASPRSMGLGDVRLAPLLGWVLGLVSVPHAVLGLVATFLLAGLWAGALLLGRRASAATHLAFGPWMLAGTWLCLLLPARLL